MRRRDFIALLSGVAGNWPVVARAQQPALPIVALIISGSADNSTTRLAAFRNGLNEAGYIECQNVTVEYHSLEGHYERLTALMADLARQRLALIAIPGSQVATLAAKAATATIPIVFGGALLVSADTFFVSQIDQFVRLAAYYAIPTIYFVREFVAAGGLMSYGTNVADGYRQAGVYTGKILKGAKPADLPVEQSTRFELVINLKTAKALGLEIPPTLLARADEVIE